MYVESGQRWLFVRHHQPVGARKPVAVLLCPPLGIEGQMAQRSYRRLAEALSAAGYPVLRLDYGDEGDSSGPVDECGDGPFWVDDLLAVAKYALATEGVDRIALIGMASGALLAGCVAARLEVSDLVLWTPWITGRSFVRAIRMLAAAGRRGVAAQAPTSGLGTTPIAGASSPLSPGALAAISEVNLTSLGCRSAPRVLLLGDASGFCDEKTTGGLADALRQRGASVTVAPWGQGGDVFEDQINEKALIQALYRIESWLAECPGSVRKGQPELHAPRASAVLQMEKFVEKPIYFSARTDGRARLFAILAEPSPSSCGELPAVVFLNAGSLPHTGPFRLYVDLARRWAALGYASLRMDLSGIGESSHACGEQENLCFPRSAVDDVISAIDALQQTTGVADVILVGLCSGASIALKAAGQDKRIVGVMMVNAWSFEVPEDEIAQRQRWSQANEAQYYLRTLASTSAALKVLRGRVDVRRATQLLAAKFRREAPRFLTGRFLRSRLGKHPALSCMPEFSWLTQRPGRALLVYGDSEPGLQYLRTRVGAKVLKQLCVDQAPSQREAIRVMNACDHTFSATEARSRLIDLLTGHLLGSPV